MVQLPQVLEVLQLAMLLHAVVLRAPATQVVLWPTLPSLLQDGV